VSFSPNPLPNGLNGEKYLVNEAAKVVFLFDGKTFGQKWTHVMQCFHFERHLGVAVDLNCQQECD